MLEVFLEKEYGITEELIQAKMERIYQIPRETIPQSDANTPNTGHLPLSDPNYECGWFVTHYERKNLLLFISWKEKG